MSYHEKTSQAAKGKWRGIMMALGVPESFLKDQHGPCPLCGGSDRFRWDNQDGRGTYICGQCGSGDGMKLAMEFTGKPFPEVASAIDGLLGNVKPDAPGKPAMAQEDVRAALQAMWHASAPMVTGDLADRYLASRGLDMGQYPKALRFARAVRDGEGGTRPCMLAMVGVYGEKKFATMHRTYLRPDGSGKADMQSPRKMMPGEIPEGACVQLSDWTGGSIGIAEGIETAIAASNIFEMPVWSAINSAMLKKWLPPPDAEDVVVFGDNDPKFGGQAAAYHLAHRLAIKGFSVSVQIPDRSGKDWADVWAEKYR
jgi:putative DNA primase/helicase